MFQLLEFIARIMYYISPRSLLVILLYDLLVNSSMYLFSGSELTYILPSDNVSKFPEMLKEFEAKRELLNVSSYGLSVTSLEEVFMKYVLTILVSFFNIKG